VHTYNLKPLPVAHGIVDTCMECGFCESACPSGHVTLTPRQRIVSTREIARLEASGTVEDLNKMMEMKKSYDYLVLDTCAADGNPQITPSSKPTPAPSPEPAELAGPEF
jgi:D-lactate dehydrogenase